MLFEIIGTIFKNLKWIIIAVILYYLYPIIKPFLSMLGGALSFIS